MKMEAKETGGWDRGNSFSHATAGKRTCSVFFFFFFFLVRRTGWKGIR